MNMFGRFDENPAMTLQDVKETKHYGRTDTRTEERTHTRTDNVKTVYPPQTKFAGGIILCLSGPMYIDQQDQDVRFIMKYLQSIFSIFSPETVQHLAQYLHSLLYVEGYT